jgi:ABC-type transport system involved in multi-copper enzyme maturation permease subunit
MTSAPAAPSSLPPLAPEAPPADALPAPRESFATRLKLLLRPSNFIAAIPGPIFNKDVWISGRKSGTYWIRFIYVILLLITISIMFAGNADDLGRASSPALRIQQLQQIAPITTKVLLWFGFVTLAIIGVILGAPTICEEKRAGTLATLLTTPLKAWQIIIGKTCAFLVQLLILGLVVAPLLLAVRVFGGVGAEEVIAGTVLVLATALLAGMCGVAFSVNVKRTSGAIMGGLLLLVLFLGAVPLLWLLTFLYNQRPMMSEDWIFNACPPAALGLVTFPFKSAEYTRTAWVSSTLYTLGASAFLMVLSSLQLRRVMTREGEGGSAIPAAKKIKKPKKGSPAPGVGTPAPAEPLPFTEETAPHPALGNTQRRRRASTAHEGVTREVGDHPVFWREMRQTIFRSRWPMAILSVAVGVALGFTYYHGGLDEDEAHVFIAVLSAIICVLGAAITPASIISGEREARTLDVLLTTPITARSIILGKAAGAMRRLWIVPAILSVHLIIAVCSELWYGHQVISPIVFLWLLLLLVPAMLFLTATGTLMSLVCKKSAGASAANFAIALGLWGIIPGILSMMIALLTHGGGDGKVLSWLWSTNPIVTLGCSVDGATDNRYRLLDVRMDFGEMLLLNLFYGAAYTGAAWLILSWAASILAHRTARLK